MDWCHPYSEHEHRLVQIIRRIGVFIASFLLFEMTIFQVFQLARGILNMTTVHSVLPYLVWFAAFPVAFITQLCYVFRGKMYLSFFADWTDFENQLALQNSHQVVKQSLRRTRILTLISTAVMRIALLIALSYVIIYYSNAPFLFSYYNSLQNILSFPVLTAIQIISIFLMLILKLMCETVPALIFYHAGLEVRVIEEEVKHLFSFVSCPKNTEKASKFETLFASKVREILNTFENLKTLVARANSLFGIFMFLAYSIEFVIICTMLYSFFHWLQTSKPLATCLTVLVVNLYDLVFCTLLTANVYRSSEHLRTVLASLLNRHWDLISKNERDILLVLLGCLRTDPLAAIPLGLYKVTFSVLLTMVSLTVSYVVIMLQSK